MLRVVSKRAMLKLSIGLLSGCIVLGTAAVQSQTPEPAQQRPPAARGRGNAAPAVISTEVLPDRQITFRISAPQAESVRLATPDISNMSDNGQMKKNESGVWETTVGPVVPGAYRYNFEVDGVSVADPRNSSISESNTHISSLVYVPGSELTDTRDVPRGAVAKITYYSKSLGRFRRMHIYTPPGYEANQEKYPIFYLLHGSGDNDNAWTTVGRAGFILDNMIAAGKVKPMVVVMPAGHTSANTSMRRRGQGGTPGQAQPRDEFGEDFVNDVMPYAESHYRVLTDQSHRAIAGLSMGGMQTRSIVLGNPDTFSYIGILSGGSIAPSDIADMASFKQHVKAVFVSYGSRENGATAEANVAALRQAGIKSVYYESPDTQHDWVTWRRSLIQLAPLLFQ